MLAAQSRHALMAPVARIATHPLRTTSRILAAARTNKKTPDHQKAHMSHALSISRGSNHSASQPVHHRASVGNIQGHQSAPIQSLRFNPARQLHTGGNKRYWEAKLSTTDNWISTLSLVGLGVLAIHDIQSDNSKILKIRKALNASRAEQKAWDNETKKRYLMHALALRMTNPKTKIIDVIRILNRLEKNLREQKRHRAAATIYNHIVKLIKIGDLDQNAKKFFEGHVEKDQPLDWLINNEPKPTTPENCLILLEFAFESGLLFRSRTLKLSQLYRQTLLARKEEQANNN